MIVVADSGPLHYLILLDYTEPLRRFYGRVLVPDAVASELSSVRTTSFYVDDAPVNAIFQRWLTS